MIGPGLHPRTQVGYDRTTRWAQSYYRAWGARVRAERESRKLAGAIPDELMNELSDSDDEKVLQLNRHAPTPTSMPGSPIMASLPKPIDTISIKSSIIESKHDCHDAGFSPVDVDGESMEPSGWQLSSRSNHQSVTRRSSTLVESTPSLTAAHSRNGMHGKFSHIAPSGSKEAMTRKHSRKSSSRQDKSKGYTGKDGEAGLRHVQRGRVGKHRSCHRDLI